MDRYYIISNKPKLYSFLDILNGENLNGVLSMSQENVIELTRCPVDSTVKIKQTQIKRVI